MRKFILGDVCDLDRTQAPFDVIISQDYPYVGMENVSGRDGVITLGGGSRTGDGKSTLFRFTSEHVLFGKLRPYLKKIAAPEFEGGCSTELVPLRPDKTKLDRKYLYHWLRRDSLISHLMGKNKGARMPRADMNVLLAQEIPLPPLEEQRRIVALLDRAAEIKRRAEAARDKARTIIPALFVNMFGDPAANTKGWDVLALGEVLEGIAGGKNLQAGTGASSPRILKVSAVTSGQLKPDESKPAPNGYLPPPSHFVRRGDFLFTRANTAELVGATTIVDAVPEDLLLPDKIWRITWREERVRPTYMLAYMQGAFFRRLMSMIASGTSDSMKNISQAKLRTLPVAVPPLSLQRNFEQQMRGSGVLAQRLSRAAQVADNTQAALSAEVFK